MVARLGKRRLVFTCLFLILAVAIFLRFFGISFGYPFNTHTDEPAVMRQVMSMANANTLLIRGFERPDSNIKIADTVLVKLYSWLMYDTSLLDPLHVQVDTEYYIVARCWSAVLGVLMVVVAYLIGKQFGTVTGLIAAALVAFDSSFVEHSHYVTSDIAIALNMMLVMLCGIAYIRKPQRKRLVGMAFFAALNALDKYNGLVTSGMIAVVVIACHWKDWKEIFIQGVISLTLYGAFMVIGSPSVFIHWRQVLHAFFVANEASHVGADGLDWWGNMQYYWGQMCTDLAVPPWLPLVLIAAALLVMLITRNKKCLVFSMVPLWWGILSKLSLHWERWGVPLYAGVILVIAYLLGEGVGFLRRKLRGVRVPSACTTAVCAILVAVYLLFFLLPGGITAATNVAKASTSTLSVDVLETYGLTEANTAYDARTPLYIRSHPNIAWPSQFRLEDGMLYRLSEETLYVLESSWQQPRYKDITSDVNADYAMWYACYSALHEQLTPIYELSPGRGYRQVANKLVDSLRGLVNVMYGGSTTGPVIRVYDVSDLPVWVEAE